jgi:hypothetical protein
MRTTDHLGRSPDHGVSRAQGTSGRAKGLMLLYRRSLLSLAGMTGISWASPRRDQDDGSAWMVFFSQQMLQASNFRRSR